MLEIGHGCVFNIGKFAKRALLHRRWQVFNCLSTPWEMQQPVWKSLFFCFLLWCR